MHDLHEASCNRFVAIGLSLTQLPYLPEASVVYDAPLIFHENTHCNTQVFDMWCLNDVLALEHSICLCPLFPQYCTMSSDQDAEQQPNFETIALLDFGSGNLDTAFSSKLMAIRWFKRWMTTLDCSLQRNLQFKTLSLEKNGWSPRCGCIT